MGYNVRWFESVQIEISGPGCIVVWAHTEFVPLLWISATGGGRCLCLLVMGSVICCPAGLASRQQSRHDRSFWPGCDIERDCLQCPQPRTEQTRLLPGWHVFSRSAGRSHKFLRRKKTNSCLIMKRRKTVTLEAVCCAALGLESSGGRKGETGKCALPHSSFASVMTH